MSLKIDVGCGERLDPGWVGVDVLYGPLRIDVEREPLPFPDGSAEAVRAIHSLEHIGHPFLPFVLSEISRVLARDGEFLCEVPDLASVLRMWLDAPEPERWGRLLWAIFGDQGLDCANPEPGNPGRYHKSGFTVGRLSLLVNQAGMAVRSVSVLRRSQYPCDVIRLTASKERGEG